MLLIFTAELTVGILAVVFQEKVVADLKLELTDKLKKEYGLTSALTAAVDLAQTRVSLPCFMENFDLIVGSLNAVELRVLMTTPLPFGNCNTWEGLMQRSAKLAVCF